MKNYKLLLSTVAGLALALVNLSASAEDRAGVVTLIHIVGEAVYSVDGGHTWVPAVVGKEFQPGTLVRTEDKSLADLLIGQSLPDRNLQKLQFNTRHDPAPNNAPIAEKNMVRLQPNTILGVDKLVVPDSDPRVVSDCELDLKKGRILASVRKVSPSAEYIVKVPNGVAAVRGTQFALAVADATQAGGNPDVSCQVVDGTVWLSLTLTGPTGAPLTDSSGNQLPPVQVSISPGSGFDATAALMSSFMNVINNGTSMNNVQAVVNQLNSLATSSVSTLSANQASTLIEFFGGLRTTVITITAPGGTILPPDTGTPPHVSSQ